MKETKPMNKPNHTPGPWIEGENCKILDQWGNTIAMAFTAIHTIEKPVMYEIDVEEQEANRTLIATAPELLEALEMLLSPLGDSDVKRKHARAAIAKEKGE